MLTALRFTIVILSLIVTQSSFAIDYKFTGNGSWSDLDNWEGRIKPPSMLEAGNTITILGTTSTGQSCGQFCSSDLGRNHGTIIIAPGGSLTLNSQTQFSQAGIINVEGTLINRTVLQGQIGSSINITGTFLNQIWFGNQGHLIIHSGGVVTNEVVEGVTHMGAGRGIFTNDFINPGTIIINEGGTINNKAPAVITLGNVTNNGGTVNNFATLMGNPIITGNLYNAGTIAPGNSPGKYTINGDYTAIASSIHAFEVDGIAAGTYDVLAATGTVNLDGRMSIALKAGVTITGSTEIPIITGTINGTFSSTTLPDGLMLDYKANSVVLKAVSALPVRFIKLEATKENSGVKLNWKVADEKGVISYEIERSENNNHFNKIGVVQAVLREVYHFNDYTPNPIAYYRVKSIDADGKHGYSPIVFLKGDVNTVVLKAFISTSGNELIVHHPIADQGTKIYIHSIDGQLLKVALAQNSTQQSTLDFPFTQSGVYIISYGKENGAKETTKVFKP